jgi:signal-transduction protein with cAMP-binding, CBS, and nucleotidyltransferase domain
MNRLTRLGIRNLSSSSTIGSNAFDIFKKSCYYKVDFKINEDQTIQEAVTRFSAMNISSLAVVDKNDALVGVLSKRDYINKVAALNKVNENLKVKEICTYGSNIIVAKKTDSLESCMNKMLFKNIHHLLITDDKNKQFIGMISMKDIIQDIMKDKQETITRLTDFNIGRGAFFGSE